MDEQRDAAAVIKVAKAELRENNTTLSNASIQRADADSQQPRFTDSATAARFAWTQLRNAWSKDSLLTIPNYSEDSRTLDKWLSDFWRTESLLSGVVSNVVSIDKNRGWTLTGGRNQVSRFTRVLRNVENGAGWRIFASKQSESYWTTNMGCVTEIGRLGDQGPMGALYHADPTRCRLTGDANAPLEYFPSTDKRQVWSPEDYFRTSSLPSIQDQFHDLGYCAVMRALQFAVLMVAIFRHDREMLFSLMPKGLLLMKGISETDWETAMQTNKELLTAKEREFFAGLSIFFSGMEGDVDAKLVSLSQLPHNFDMESWTNMLMYGYALVFGYDPREFWPVSGGSLGTGRESEIQAIKASGKGGLDWALSFQDNLQRELPPTLLFEFEQRDEAGEAAEYEAIKAYAEAVNAMAAPASNMDAPTLSSEQRRILYAEKGFIPEEWTITEEDVTSTDTEMERMLSQPAILRACDTFRDEPIVRLSWHWRSGYQIRTLWNSGAQALTPRTYYSVPKQRKTYEPDEVLFENEEVIITGADVQRSIQKWDQRHDDEWQGLPDAETVDESD